MKTVYAPETVDYYINFISAHPAELFIASTIILMVVCSFNWKGF